MGFLLRSAQCLAFLGISWAAMPAAAQDRAPAPSSDRPAASTNNAPSPPAKPKKVFTNDDVRAAPPENSPAAKAKGSVSGTDSNEANSRLARDLKGRLDRLTELLSAVDKKIDELKRFEAGQGPGTAGGQVYKGYSTEPVPEQIQKLEAKRQQIADQMDAIYDEARKKGILPGQLR